MIEWVLGISAWILLVVAVYLFFRSKFEEVGELFGEDAEDDYEEAEEFEEPVLEDSEGGWEEGSWEEGTWNEGGWEEGSWNEGGREEGSWNEGGWEEGTWNEGGWEEGSWNEGGWEEGTWGEGGQEESIWNEGGQEEGSWNEGGWEEGTWGEEDTQTYYLEEAVPRKRRRSWAVPDDSYIKDGKNNNRRKERRRAGIFGWLAIPLALLGAIYLLLPYYCVRGEMTINAGENCPGVEAFLKWGNIKASYVSQINENTVLNRGGDYGVVIKVYGREVAAILHVKGTVEPHIATRKVAIFCGESVRADDFVEEVEGITPVDIRFAKEPDCATGGINTVLLEIEDEVGNVTTAEALLEVIDDTEPPVIHGVGELTMTAGGSVSYKKGVTVTDNYDQDVKLEVDSSAVNVDKAGDYRVIYNAVDSAGNKTSVSTVLHVLPVTIDTVTEENIYAEADKILEKILTDSMSPYEQAKAIYDWCHSNIAYSDGTPKTNWVQGAYRGLVNRKGDCYVYAATAKCLLTRVGIKNMDIEKIPAKSMHYWNLIDIGEGWRHFDTCRRKDGSTFFYKTDEELMEYSNAHNKSHNYDRNLYPEIK